MILLDNILNQPATCTQALTHARYSCTATLACCAPAGPYRPALTRAFEAGDLLGWGTLKDCDSQAVCSDATLQSKTHHMTVTATAVSTNVCLAFTLHRTHPHTELPLTNVGSIECGDVEGTAGIAQGLARMLQQDRHAGALLKLQGCSFTGQGFAAHERLHGESGRH